MAGKLKEFISKNLGRKNKIVSFNAIGFLLGVGLYFFYRANEIGISFLENIFYFYGSIALCSTPFLIVSFFLYKPEKSKSGLFCLIAGLILGAIWGVIIVFADMEMRTGEVANGIGILFLYFYIWSSVVAYPFILLAVILKCFQFRKLIMKPVQ